MKETPTIIGISGKIGSGKDTFAEKFALMSKTPCQRHAFADKVREMVELLTGYKMGKIYTQNDPFYNEVYSYSQSIKNVYVPLWDKTIGECLQMLGTDALRKGFDENTWIKSLFSTVGFETIKMGHHLLIPDVRFPNEADEILERGGIVIRLFGDPMDIRKNSKRNLNHLSETALDNYHKFTYVFESTDFTSLEKNIIKVIENLDS